MCYSLFYDNIAAIFLKVFQETFLASLSTAMARECIKTILQSFLDNAVLFTIQFSYSRSFSWKRIESREG